MKIPGELARELYWAEDGGEENGWTRVCDQEQTAQYSRWHVIHLLVIWKDEEFWGFEFQVGATENQENEYPWEGPWNARDELKDVTLTRLYPHQILTTIYRNREQQR